MTTIVEGMTPAQFITAMNDNFAEIKYQTTAITTIAGDSNISVVETNFQNVRGETYSAPTTYNIVAGISGRNYIDHINANFNNYSAADFTITVGADKNFTTIGAAITRAFAGNTLRIDGEIYYELNVWVTKTLTFQGLPGISVAMAYNISSGIICHYKNMNTTGRWWTTLGVAITGAKVIYEDCNVYFDADDDINGLHIYEDAGTGNEVNIINGSVLEFSGHSGSYFTMGCALVVHQAVSPKIVITDSYIIENANQNTISYATIMSARGELEVRNSTLEIKNYDGVNKKTNIIIFKYAGDPLNVTLEDVTFINDVPDRYAIHIVKDVPLDENDWIVASGLVNQTQQADICSDMADWNYLIANAP